MFAAYIGYYIAILGALHDTGTVIALVAVIVIIFLVVGAVRWSQRRESEQQLQADIATAPPELVARLQRLAYALAAIAERGLGEVWLIRNSVPEGRTVITRQIQIDTLRKREIWTICRSRPATG